MTRVIVLSLVLAAGCSDQPRLNGSSRLVVGQRIEVTLERGDGFVRNDIKLVASDGREFTQADLGLEYTYTSGEKIAFTVPPGVAAGPARVEIGVEGRGPYIVDVQIVRVLGVLDAVGKVDFFDLGDNSRFASASVGEGPGVLVLSPSGGKAAAITVGQGIVHFYELGDNPPAPFAPGIQLPNPVGRGGLYRDSLLLPSLLGVAYIKDRGAELQHVMNIDLGPVAALSVRGGSVNRVVAVGSTTDASPVDHLHVLSIETDPPSVLTRDEVLPGVGGGVVDVALAPSGEVAFAINAVDNGLIRSDLFTSPTRESLPTGDEGPTRVAFSPDGEWLAILCQTSKTIAVYSIASNTASHTVSIPADPRGGALENQSPPVDLSFAAPARLYVLLADGRVESARLTSTVTALTHVLDSRAGGASALFVQP